MKDALRAIVTDKGLRLFWGFFVVVCLVVWVSHLNEPVPRCEFVNGREVVTGHCIPYCPPDPKECG